jgi:hypothetical protein
MSEQMTRRVLNGIVTVATPHACALRVLRRLWHQHLLGAFTYPAAM